MGPPDGDGDGDEPGSGDGDLRPVRALGVGAGVPGADLSRGVALPGVGVGAGVCRGWSGEAATIGPVAVLATGPAVALAGGCGGATEGAAVCTSVTGPVGLPAVIRDSGSTTNTSSAQATAARLAATALRLRAACRLRARSLARSSTAGPGSQLSMPDRSSPTSQRSEPAPGSSESASGFTEGVRMDHLLRRG